MSKRLPQSNPFLETLELTNQLLDALRPLNDLKKENFEEISKLWTLVFERLFSVRQQEHLENPGERKYHRVVLGMHFHALYNALLEEIATKPFKVLWEKMDTLTDDLTRQFKKRHPDSLEQTIEKIKQKYAYSPKP